MVLVNKIYEYNEISREQWIEILQDTRVIDDELKKVFNIIYSTENKKLNAQAIANALGYNHFIQLNRLVGQCGKRIKEIYTLKETETLKYNNSWIAVFNGDEVRKKGKVYFNWILKPNMIAAIEELNFFDILDVFPEEIQSDNLQELIEGAKKKIVVNAFERNSKARKVCVEYYGYKCYVCNFDFGDFYGPEFEGKIHVHHLKALSEIREEYKIDPINDLRPVCPNCHLALHSSKGNIPYTIEELQKKLKMLENKTALSPIMVNRTISKCG